MDKNRLSLFEPVIFVSSVGNDVAG